LIANQLKRFYKKIFKTLYQNKFLPDNMVTEEEKMNHSSRVQTWVNSLLNSSELLLTLQTISQKPFKEGKSSQMIFKIKAGSSSKKPLLQNKNISKTI